MAKIHPSAIVSSKARISDEVEVGPCSVVEADVEIGPGSKLEAHAILKAGSRIGKSVTIGNFSVVGGLPQDLQFDARIETYAIIGDNSVLREGVTVNRSTREGLATEVGSNCFLMANSHIGHDCKVGDKVVFANGSLLAGHVSVGSYTFLGGNAAVHQFCRLGEGVMCGGHSAVAMDIAPFTIVSERDTLFGINVVGLRRRGVARESIEALQALYRSVFFGVGNVRAKAKELRDEYASVREAEVFLTFFEGGKRGFARPGRK